MKEEVDKKSEGYRGLDRYHIEKKRSGGWQCSSENKR